MAARYGSEQRRGMETLWRLPHPRPPCDYGSLSSAKYWSFCNHLAATQSSQSSGRAYHQIPVAHENNSKAAITTLFPLMFSLFYSICCYLYKRSYELYMLITRIVLKAAYVPLLCFYFYPVLCFVCCYCGRLVVWVCRWFFKFLCVSGKVCVSIR